jgi:hypothetical protein
MPSLPSVVIYRSSACSDFRTLKAWLTRLGITFEERHLSDPETMAVAKPSSGVCIAPITVIGNQVFQGTFQSQKSRIAEALIPAAIG